ncbi:trypsin-like serine protease [Corynebacterium macginleyi]|uniref:trypsin-like serine protease n=1 Tax=Corynebacterium macginleyi TaxID=38290 RepID=UPI000EF9EBA8|nr:trypsin-like serine protease [Corynebacterium macginleyi]QRP22003.1 trypsin-like serine protease [Corynebacterium macginleyi]RMB66825.1 trypsin [Corynebacterium macginleyi]
MVSSLLTAALFAVAACRTYDTQQQDRVVAQFTETLPAAPPNEFYEPAVVPMLPGAALNLSANDPQPGEYFTFQSCTAAWSFALADGRSIAVTASHCGKPGDKVWAGTQAGDFAYPADPVGEVVYSDFFAADTHHLDVAFIELYRDADYFTPGEVATTVATRLHNLPDAVCKLGNTTNVTCGNVKNAVDFTQLNYQGLEHESNAALAQMCSAVGDSGGPVYGDVDGRQTIVGLVSGTTEPLDEGHSCEDTQQNIAVAFTTAPDIQELALQVLGPVA